MRHVEEERVTVCNDPEWPKDKQPPHKNIPQRSRRTLCMSWRLAVWLNIQHRRSAKNRERGGGRERGRERGREGESACERVSGIT
jgi:hypothetical protein